MEYLGNNRAQHTVVGEKLSTNSRSAEKRFAFPELGLRDKRVRETMLSTIPRALGHCGQSRNVNVRVAKPASCPSRQQCAIWVSAAWREDAIPTKAPRASPAVSTQHLVTAKDSPLWQRGAAQHASPSTSPVRRREVWKALNIEVLRADDGEARYVLNVVHGGVTDNTECCRHRAAPAQCLLVGLQNISHAVAGAVISSVRTGQVEKAAVSHLDTSFCSVRGSAGRVRRAVVQSQADVKCVDLRSDAPRGYISPSLTVSQLAARRRMGQPPTAWIQSRIWIECENKPCGGIAEYLEYTEAKKKVAKTADASEMLERRSPISTWEPHRWHHRRGQEWNLTLSGLDNGISRLNLVLFPAVQMGPLFETTTTNPLPAGQLNINENLTLEPIPQENLPGSKTPCSLQIYFASEHFSSYSCCLYSQAADALPHNTSGRLSSVTQDLDRGENISFVFTRFRPLDLLVEDKPDGEVSFAYGRRMQNVEVYPKLRFQKCSIYSESVENAGSRGLERNSAAGVTELPDAPVRSQYWQQCSVLCEGERANIQLRNSRLLFPSASPVSSRHSSRGVDVLPESHNPDQQDTASTTRHLKLNNQ
ncbi:hypothetical protein PR048_006076 [Dryococelus australis]|uniref:Uncharacterized protein n=1 Tax=Dryococelus australis TaxID=614101 RepID=A0ABQ9I9Y5_9NEOP|nr:hypothetical protein PR048_006076 [Dryococelus australis]